MTCVDRLVGNGQHTIATKMTEVQVKGLQHVEVRDVNGDLARVALELKFKDIVVQPPIGKKRHYPPLRLFVLHATERSPPRGRKATEWKLITDLPERSRQEAIEKIEWYAMRWRIEFFHKVLKSGCRAEDSKLRTADRLANLMAVFCILSWRVLWLMMMARAAPDEPPDIALTRSEIRILDGLVADTGNRRCKIGTLAFYIIKARLGGYLTRTSDPPPGIVVIWRGLARLTDIELGAELGGARIVGN